MSDKDASALRLCIGARHAPDCHHGPRARVRALSNWRGEEGLDDDGPTPEYWRGWNAAVDAAIFVLTDLYGTQEP